MHQIYVPKITRKEKYKESGYRLSDIFFYIVTGYDFTGQSSVSMSAGVKIDITPPEVTESNINLYGRHITDRKYVEAWYVSEILYKQYMDNILK